MKKIKKQPSWKIDFLNIISERISEFKKNNDGNFDNDFETIVDCLGYDMEADIEAVKFDAETILDDDALRNDFFNCLEFDYYEKLSDSEGEILCNILERSGYGVIKLQSLAEEILFDEVKEKMNSNPYQLTLKIA